MASVYLFVRCNLYWNMDDFYNRLDIAYVEKECILYLYIVYGCILRASVVLYLFVSSDVHYDIDKKIQIYLRNRI